MKSIKTVGLSLVVVLALSALVASAAPAATFMTCVASDTGEYTSSNCSVKSQKAHKGKFEIAPVEQCFAQEQGEYTDSTCSVKSKRVHKGSFEKDTHLKFTESGGRVYFERGTGRNWGSCEGGSTGKGEITGPKTATIQITYTECKRATDDFHSTGPDGTQSGQAGEIITNKTAIRLLGPGEKASGPEGRVVPAGEVWTELTSIEHAPYEREFIYASIQCNRVSGTLAAAVESVNHLSFRSDLSFPRGDESNYVVEWTNDQACLSEWSPPEHFTLEQNFSILFEKEVQVSTS